MKKKPRQQIFKNANNVIHYREDCLLILSESDITVYTADKKLKEQLFRLLKIEPPKKRS